MYKRILVPVDLADTDLVKPAIATSIEMARGSGGSVRLINVLAMTPVMLAEYVPPDFDVQQRKSAEEALTNGWAANQEWFLKLGEALP
jgi:nucleotide-binding universal stress UspA family protein